MAANISWTDVLAALQQRKLQANEPAQPRFEQAAGSERRPHHRARGGAHPREHPTRAPLGLNARKYSLRNVTGCGGEMDTYRRSACLWLDQWAEKAPIDAFRPARSTRRQPPQQIPRLIVQLVHARNEPPKRPRQQQLARYRHGWRSLNPEYAYLLLDDADCTSFVDTVGTERHKAAYAAVKLGSQKADLFRAYWIALLGGIYADVDMELQRPLREWVPRNASAVSSSHWEFAFLAYAPLHPIMTTFRERAVDEVLSQAMFKSWSTPFRCEAGGAPDQGCVLHATGPVQYSRVVQHTTARAGCTTSWSDVPRVSADCAEATDERFSSLHICAQPAFNDPVCGVVVHWDCQNSARADGCQDPKHYSHGSQEYFHPAKSRTRAPIPSRPDKSKQPRSSLGR